MKPIKARVKRLRERWKALRSHEKWGVGLVIEIVVAIAFMSYSVSNFPEFLPNTTISNLTPSYLIVEVTLLLLMTQIPKGDIRTWATAVNIASVVLTLFTMISSNIGTAFKILSTNTVTWDFTITTLLLLLGIELTALGLLMPRVRELHPFLTGDYWKKYIK